MYIGYSLPKLGQIFLEIHPSPFLIKVPTLNDTLPVLRSYPATRALLNSWLRFPLIKLKVGTSQVEVEGANCHLLWEAELIQTKKLQDRRRKKKLLPCLI